MALALKMNPPVISLSSWELPGAAAARSPEEAMKLLQRMIAPSVKGGAESKQEQKRDS
jgi:hypothetical protein